MNFITFTASDLTTQTTLRFCSSVYSISYLRLSIMLSVLTRQIPPAEDEGMFVQDRQHTYKVT